MSVFSPQAVGRASFTTSDLRRRPVQASDVVILAHRGCPAPDRAENSVAAVCAAMDCGADGVEVDVRLTADGVLVCSHDPDVLSSTGERFNVAASRHADLRRASGNASRSGAAGPALATCEEVLLAAGQYGRTHLVVEAKPAPDVATGLHTAYALREVLTDFATSLNITVSSFDPELLSSIRDALVGLEVRTALLGTPSTPLSNLLRRAANGGIHDIHPHALSALEAPDVVGAARALGIGVTCWTVNDECDARRLAALGVDAVITDDPAGLGTALRERRRRVARRTPRRVSCRAAALPR